MAERLARLSGKVARPIIERWQQWGLPLGPQAAGEDAWPEIEGAVGDALRPVGPSDRFRETLRNNLSMAAESRLSGLVIEYPKPYRGLILLGLSASLLAALVTAFALWMRSRPDDART